MHGIYTYRVIQEESALLWEMIIWVILSKKVHTNMGPILNGYGVMSAWNLEEGNDYWQWTEENNKQA